MLKESSVSEAVASDVSGSKVSSVCHKTVMVWSPLHSLHGPSVMAAPDGVPSNENVKESSSGSKGELYKFVHSLVIDGITGAPSPSTSQNLSGCRLSPEPLWCGLRPATQSEST